MSTLTLRLLSYTDNRKTRLDGVQSLQGIAIKLVI